MLKRIGEYLGILALVALMLLPQIFSVERARAAAVAGTRVYHSTSIGVLNNTWQEIGFTSERYDYGGLHSNSPQSARLIAPTQGVYIICFNGAFATNSTGQRGSQLELNDTTLIASIMMNAAGGGFRTHVPICTLY